MTAPLVGIMGRKRAGKDSVAARLVGSHGFKRYAFADALREAALALDPIVTPLDTVSASLRLSEVVAMLGWEGAKSHAEVRRTLQNFGQGIRRIDPDFWLRPVLAQVAADGLPAVITDVRYPNEAEAIKQAGGVLVRVVRPGLGWDEADLHESETALDYRPADRTLRNGSTLADLDSFSDSLARWVRYS